MSSPSYSRFLALPPELRSIVYHYYLFEDGYHFHYESGKFRLSDAQPIDLSLMYTCKSIAAEMYGLALKTNTLVFKTVYLEAEAERMKAGRFDCQVAALAHSKNQIMTRTQKHLTSEMKAMIIGKYPQFELALNGDTDFDIGHWQMNRRCWGESRHVYDGFINYTLELLLKYKREDFFNSFRSRGPSGALNVDQELSSNPTPWMVPSEDEVTRMSKIVKIPGPFLLTEDEERVWLRVKHRF